MFYRIKLDLSSVKLLVFCLVCNFLLVPTVYSKTLEFRAYIADVGIGTIYFHNTNTNSIDSTAIIGHRASCIFEISEAFLCSIFIKQYKSNTSMVSTVFEGGILSLYASNQQIDSIVSTNPINIAFRQQEVLLDTFRSRINSIQTKQGGDNDSLKEVRKMVYLKYIADVQSFVVKHRSDMSSTLVLDGLIIKNNIINPQDIVLAYSHLEDSIKNSSYGQRIRLRIEKNSKFNSLAIAPDFELFDIRNQLTSLKGFKGKKVILHFWASWCAPCRIQNKEIAKNNETSSVSHVFISFDSDKQEWQKAIATDSLKAVNFTHLWTSATGAFDSKVAKDYQVYGIPKVILINADLSIFSKNPTRDQIHQFSLPPL